jgi:hypothetical protein
MQFPSHGPELNRPSPVLGERRGSLSVATLPWNGFDFEGTPGGTA